MYTIKEASVRSGVGIPLLRAWERRYGVVVPTRTASGYRVYDDVAINRLRAMRDLISNGWSAQQAAERVRTLPDDELPQVAEAGVHPEATPGAMPFDPSTTDELIGRFVEAAKSIDAPAIEATLDEAFSAARFEVVADGVVMPALHALGDAWERGDVSVAGEHAASHAVLRRLAMAYEAAGDSVAEQPILIGLGPGARHELGALAFAVAARRAGLSVLYLGPDLPAESWATAAVERDAIAAVIGVPTRADVGRARAVIDALRSSRPGMPLAVGGDEATRMSATGALILPQNLRDAISTLREELAQAT